MQDHYNLLAREEEREMLPLCADEGVGTIPCTLISLFDDDFSVACDQLARCLLDVAKNGSQQHLLENRAIREWK